MFVVDDQDHPQISEVHAELKRLSRHMDDAGYVPNTKFILHDVEEEELGFGCVITIKNWPLPMGSSAHLWVSHCTSLRIYEYAVSATLPPSSFQRR
jgi:hypothetical protein